ncbi:hypothetical protein [Streptomyces sirii]|uniref:hypothetical protein n=1 Tax=Streptomyces sirii TaxID=3127701 RepID=UPI003D36AD6A
MKKYSLVARGGLAATAVLSLMSLAGVSAAASPGDRTFEKDGYKFTIKEIKAAEEGKKLIFAGTFSCPTGKAGQSAHILLNFNITNHDAASGRQSLQGGLALMCSGSFLRMRSVLPRGRRGVSFKRSMSFIIMRAMRKRSMATDGKIIALGRSKWA